MPTCVWCHENEASLERLDPIGEPWCGRCADAEEAVQAQKRVELGWQVDGLASGGETTIWTGETKRAELEAGNGG